MPKVFLVVTVDTEPDCTPGWRRSDPLTYHSVREGIPDLLQPMFLELGARPTYLISNDVLENRECLETLSSLEGEFELGAHLHSEYIKPRKKYVRYDGTKALDYPCFDYPYEVEREKIANLTKLFKDGFGYPPRSYRAGRYGADADTIRILEELDYKIETSVTPHINWKSKGGPDFSQAPEQPYHPSSQDITRPGSSSILEIPISIGPKKRRFYPDIWFLRKMLRPSTCSVKEMTDVIEGYIKEYANREKIVLNMMFHSMEVIPKASPYTKNQRDVDRFLDKIRNVLEYCRKREVRFSTLDYLAGEFERII